VTCDFSSQLLDAFVERIRLESERLPLPVARDPSLSAVDKLQGFFDALDQVRAARKADVAALGRVWYDDANAVVRQRVDDAIRAQRAPLLTEIVRQGVREGVFSTPFPEQAGGVIMSLLQGMGDPRRADARAGSRRRRAATGRGDRRSAHRVLGRDRAGAGRAAGRVPPDGCGGRGLLGSCPERDRRREIRRQKGTAEMIKLAGQTVLTFVIGVVVFSALLILPAWDLGYWQAGG
jgi:hypothetical protein